VGSKVEGFSNILDRKASKLFKKGVEKRDPALERLILNPTSAYTFLPIRGIALTLGMNKSRFLASLSKPLYVFVHNSFYNRIAC